VELVRQYRALGTMSLPWPLEPPRAGYNMVTLQVTGAKTVPSGGVVEGPLRPCNFPLAAV
jgi:hypothetical protein